LPRISKTDFAGGHSLSRGLQVRNTDWGIVGGDKKVTGGQNKQKTTLRDKTRRLGGRSDLLISIEATKRGQMVL